MSAAPSAVCEGAALTSLSIIAALATVVDRRMPSPARGRMPISHCTSRAMGTT